MARLTKAQQAELELQRKAQAMKEFRDGYDNQLKLLIRDINFVNTKNSNAFVVSVDAPDYPCLIVVDTLYDNHYNLPMSASNVTLGVDVSVFYDLRRIVDEYIAEIKEAQHREEVKRNALEKIRQVLNEEELELLKSENLKL